MTDFEINPFHPTDITDIINLWERCDLLRPWNNPKVDIETAQKTDACRIIVGKKDNSLIASVLVGFDGHRGWIYYQAVHPKHQGLGYGKILLQAAEDFLKSYDCQKVELMIRPENHTIRKFYEKLGYEVEDRTLMVRWLSSKSKHQTKKNK